MTSTKKVILQLSFVHDALEQDRAMGSILNELLDRGLTRREAVVCVRQAQEEREDNYRSLGGNR